MEIVLTPKRVARTLGIVAAVLLIHHSLIKVIEFNWFRDEESRVFDYYSRLFTVNSEGVVPTFFSVLLLLCCAVLLTVIARAVLDRTANRFAYYQWLALGLIFTFLAIDEGFEIHEGLSSPVSGAVGGDDWLDTAWVIPYSMLFIVVAVSYSRLVLALPPPTRNLFVISAALYMFGAVGMEIIGGRQALSQGTEVVSYAASATIEELFEMGGLIIFIYALLSHIRSDFRPPVAIAISMR